jgi:hypothetical protein
MSNELPKPHGVVKRANSGYEWELTMIAADASGNRRLGYRASGYINKTGKIIFKSGPQVQDERRDVWTTMNDTDRPDIRKSMENKVLAAAKELKNSSKATFEFQQD